VRDEVFGYWIPLSAPAPSLLKDGTQGAVSDGCATELSGRRHGHWQPVATARALDRGKSHHFELALAMTALFIGQSPLQVLNLVEASHREEEDALFLLVWDNEQTKTQIDVLLKRLGVRNVRFLRLGPALRILHPVILLPLAARLRGNVNRVYFGTYTSWASFLINLVGAKEHVLVDDGQKTINILTAPHLVGIGEKWRPWPWSRTYVQQAELFTFYDELAQSCGRRARVNRLDSVVSQLKDTTIEVQPAGPGDVLFVGTYLQDTYGPFESDLEQVMEHAGERRLLYIMHRRDNTERMRALGARLGFEVVLFDLPLELVFHLLWSQHRPEVWTFGSTATDTLQAMLPDLRIRVFQLDPEGFTRGRTGQAFRSIYEQYVGNERTDLVALER